MLSVLPSGMVVRGLWVLFGNDAGVVVLQDMWSWYEPMINNPTEFDPGATGKMQVLLPATAYATASTDARYCLRRVQ